MTDNKTDQALRFLHDLIDLVVKRGMFATADDVHKAVAYRDYISYQLRISDGLQSTNESSQGNTQQQPG